MFFKNVNSAKLSLIETTCSTTQNLQNSPQFLLSKLSTRNFKYKPLSNPFDVLIADHNIMTIQRFYLRIQ